MDQGQQQQQVQVEEPRNIDVFFPRREAVRQMIIRYQERVQNPNFLGLNLVQLQEQIKVFTKVYEKITMEHLKAVEVAGIQHHADQLSIDLIALEQIYLDIVVRYRERIGAIEGENQLRLPQEQHGAEALPLNQRVLQVHDSFLEKIKPMKFGGRPAHWPKWRAMFDSLIHHKDTLSATEKFHFLVDALDGEAKQRVMGWSK